MSATAAANWQGEDSGSMDFFLLAGCTLCFLDDGREQVPLV